MTREEILAVALPKVRNMRRRLMWRNRVNEEMAEDCGQEALVGVMEDAEEINAEIDAGQDAVAVVYRHMWRSAGRYLYRNIAAVSKVKSLDAPLTDSEGSLTLGDLVVYRSDPSADVDRRVDARKCAKVMESLSGEEIGILMAFADEVPLAEIANEAGQSVTHVLSVRKAATEKVKSGLFNAVAEKLLLAAIANPKAKSAKMVLEGARA